MSHPVFCPTRYDRYNDIGCSATRHFYESIGYTFIPEPEAYASHDLTMRSPTGVLLRIETEVTKKWVGKAFPYTYMSVPTRKQNSKADVFVKVNLKGNSILVCKMSVVKASPIIKKDTTLSSNESFFNVDVSTISSYYLMDGMWYTEDDEDTTP